MLSEKQAARFPNEHQAGIHRAGSPARELFN